MSAAATASIRVLRPIVAGLTAAQVDAALVLKQLGADPEIMSDPDARVPHELAIGFWLAALKATGDPCFGLHAAETLRPGTLDVADYAARASTNFRAGLECYIRFTKLNHDVAQFTITAEGEHARITHGLPGGRVLPRAPAEYIAGAWVVLGHQMTGVDWQAEEVEFGHAEPDDLSEYRRLFGAGARFKFGADRISMVFPSGVLDLPLVEANAGLCEVLTRHAEQLLGQMPSVDSFSDQVRGMIVKELQGGDPGVENLAEKLRMSASTLHRRLKDEGSSHRQILDSLRAELAERYLGERGLAVSEVAFLLGFSEASAFHRAFKRWTGKTPAAFRQHESTC